MTKQVFIYTKKNDFAVFSHLFSFNSIFIIILLITSSKIYSQNNKISNPKPLSADTILQKSSLKDDYNEKRALKFAIHYKDYQSAITIMYSIIAKEQKNAIWRDSLCVLYFLNRSFPQCIATGDDILAGNVTNERIAVLQAISYRNVNNLKEALNVYDKLYAKYLNPYYLYEVAQLQYFLKRNAEFTISINTLLKMPDDNAKDMSLTILSDSENQKVPFKAAVYNLKGVVLKDSENKEEAIKSFEEALKIFPEFKLAKANLEDIKKRK